jgi:hypothetical protein
MKKILAVRKNLDLLNEFMRYAFENPKILEGIPPEAEMIILPIDAPELYEYNKKMADKITAQGRKVIFVRMKRPDISIPELELMSAPPQ